MKGVSFGSLIEKGMAPLACKQVPKLLLGWLDGGKGRGEREVWRHRPPVGPGFIYDCDCGGDCG